MLTKQFKLGNLGGHIVLLICSYFGTAFAQNPSTSSPNSLALSANGNSVQVTKNANETEVEPKESEVADDKHKNSPPALASDSIVRLSQLRQEAAELATQIEDFQREAAQLQKRGQRLQGRLQAAEREALERAGLDPDKYALDDSFKPVKRQAQRQAQREPGRPNKAEAAKAPEAKPDPKKPETKPETNSQAPR
jgi:hypothetical protein